MKITAAVLAPLMFAFAAGEIDLDALIDERVEINKQYKKEYVEGAKEARNSELLVKCESGVADGWLELLAYAKQSQDVRLKKIVLKLDYYEELRSFGYDKEYSETPEEHRDAREGVAEYQAKLRAIGVGS